MLHARLSNPVAALCAILAGGVAALGFEPWNLVPLTVLGIAVLTALIDTAPSVREAAKRGWLFGAGHFAVGLTWIATAFTFQAKMPAGLGWVAVIGLAMFLAIYVALAAALARGFAKGPLGRVLILAAAWMLAEWLRGWVLSGFAWNPLGAAWVDVPGVRQTAQYGGALALSGITMLLGGGLWLMARPGALRRERLVGVGIAAAVLVMGLAGTGLDRPQYDPDGPVVFLVQPNIGQDVKYSEGAGQRHLQVYLDLTRSALGAAAADRDAGALVLWSESSVPYAVEEDPEARALLASVLGPRDLLLFGGVAVIRDKGGEVTALTNSLFVIDASGRLLGRYDKAHLVPLGEYVPARPVMARLGLTRLTPGDLDFAAGPGPRTLAMPGFPSVGVQICYEIIFPGAVVDRANRPAWIANISNDAWFGASGPPQHLAQARLRAIEEGLPVARATPTGISAMIDARGNVVVSQPAGTQGVVSAALPPALAPTVFARWGHGVTLGFGLLLVVVGVWVDRRRG